MSRFRRIKPGRPNAAGGANDEAQVLLEQTAATFDSLVALPQTPIAARR